METSINTLVKELEEIRITEANEGGDLVLSSSFEEVLVKIKKAEEITKTLKATAASLLLNEFKKHDGLLKFEGDQIRASRIKKKTKVIIGDPGKMYENEFLRKFLKISANSESLELYRKTVGDLPEGFAEEEISDYVEYRVIKKKNGKTET